MIWVDLAGKLLALALIPVAFAFFWTAVRVLMAPESAFRILRENPKSDLGYDLLTK